MTRLLFALTGLFLVALAAIAFWPLETAEPPLAVLAVESRAVKAPAAASSTPALNTKDLIATIAARPVFAPDRKPVEADKRAKGSSNARGQQRANRSGAGRCSTKATLVGVAVNGSKSFAYFSHAPFDPIDLGKPVRPQCGSWIIDTIQPDSVRLRDASGDTKDIFVGEKLP